jgi:hypothetical protein
MRKISVLFPALIVFFGFLVISSYSPVSGSTSVDSPVFQRKTGNVKLDLNFGKFPLYFIANKGQVNKKAAFYAKASRYTLWLAKEGLVFDSIRKAEKEGKTKRDVSRLLFLNANKNPEMVPINETKHKVNYFKGNDPAKWDCSIPTSRAVLYKSLYKNTTLRFTVLKNKSNTTGL